MMLSRSFPRTVKEAVQQVKLELRTEEKKVFITTSEDELSTSLHHSLGRSIRNEFGLWGVNDALREDCLRVLKADYPKEYNETKKWWKLDEIKSIHPDDASTVIIRKLWAEINKEKACK